MGFSDSSKCRNHPNQKQIPGVCSSCLREKLSNLNTTPSSTRRRTNLVAVANSSSLSATPSDSSSATTATGNHHRHRRNGSEVYVSVGKMVLNNGLKKSKSVTCAPLSRNRGGNLNYMNDNGKIIDGSNEKLGFGLEEQDGKGKKKGGFLKRLIHSTSKKTSMTMKERSHATTAAT